MKELTFKILVKETVKGNFLAVAPTLPACFAEASTEDEAVDKLQEVIGNVLKEMLSKNAIITDDSNAQFYNLTVELAIKE